MNTQTVTEYRNIPQRIEDQPAPHVRERERACREHPRSRRHSTVARSPCDRAGFRGRHRSQAVSGFEDGRQAGRGPAQKLKSETGFQFGDVSREHRWADMELLRCADEASSGEPKCPVPAIDGAYLSDRQKEALWG
jgi:hypothetical protein